MKENDGRPTPITSNDTHGEEKRGARLAIFDEKAPAEAIETDRRGRRHLACGTIKPGSLWRSH